MLAPTADIGDPNFLENSDILIFIDTNKFLDFYRSEDPIFQGSMIARLGKIRNKLR